MARWNDRRLYQRVRFPTAHAREKTRQRTPGGMIHMISSDKYDTAYHAAITWMGKTGVTADPRFTRKQLLSYADGIALSLVMGEGTRNSVVNGMELVHTPWGWRVETR